MDCDLMTFGEAMIRLTSPDHMRLEQARTLEMSVGGAEWNVAVNIARLGMRTAWVSRLVDNWSGRVIADRARRHGVNVDHVVWVPFDGVGRVRNGFYHMEQGAGPRASSVTYDRGHSAVSLMTPDMVDWQELLSGCRWLHSTGITPGLSEALADTVVEVFRIASELDVCTSYDLNYRGKLWSPGEAQEVNARVVPYVEALLGNEEDFEKCLGIKAAGTTEDYSTLDPGSYEEVAREAMDRFPRVRMVGTTLRNAKSGLLNDWRTLLYDGDEVHLSRLYEDLELVDRVGGGDSFASSIIYGMLQGWPTEEICRFGAAYSALAHTFPGDINWATETEARGIMGGGTARISR